MNPCPSCSAPGIKQSPNAPYAFYCSSCASGFNPAPRQHGHLRLSSDVGAVLDLPLIAEVSSHQRFPDYVPGEGPRWTMIELMGPLPPGRVFFHTTAEQLTFEVGSALPPGAPLGFGIRRYMGSPIRIGYERAEGRTARGELLWGPPSMKSAGLARGSVPVLTERTPAPARYLPAAEEKRKPAGFSVAVPCGSGRCGYTTVYPIGETDPAQHRCTHVFYWDPVSGAMGKVRCDGCGLSVDMRDLESALEAAGMDPRRLRRRYDRKGNALADGAQRLQDENRTLLAENAQLRRRVEKLERSVKKGGR